ncbi:MAG: DEAD/DEAH box helicase family protein, partial [Deltaproteobacteria bacterium]|nr:DEAD/DEAH box helicase family protein [Deltaproteobacteria bacterium]
VEQQASEKPEYKHNVKALKAVQPEELDIEFIYFKLGSSWLPNDLIQQFISTTMEVDTEVQQARTRETSAWKVSPRSRHDNAKNVNTWGTGRVKGHVLVQDALNLKRTKVYDSVQNPEGGMSKVLNAEATLAATEKQKEIQAEFLKWSKSHEKWGPDLAKIYNEEFNGYVLRTFDPPDVKYFPNASRERELRWLQKKAVARGLQESTLFSHGVGTGKTGSFVTLAMEMRRIGTARKPLIVVQNATIKQYAKSFHKLYPQARVLIPSDGQRKGKNRKKLLSQIATGDWDAVILPHSFFDGIADDAEREAAFVQEQLDEIEATVDEFEAAEGKGSLTVKQMKALKKRKQAHLEKLLNRRVDDALKFEQLGVDALLIDEAHNYKRSEFFTKMGQVKGIDQGSAQRSTSLLLKADYIRQKTGGKNIILATGTPISNTTAELWTMIRYIRPDLLEEYNATLFDDFAANFGDTTVALEETESGTFKSVERFNKYVNGPELLTMFHTASDVVLTQDAGLVLPKIKTGKPEMVVVERTNALSGFIEILRDTREHWEQLTGREKMRQRHVPLVLFGQARKAAVDLRLIDPQHYKDDPGSKLNTAIENIYQIYEDTAEDNSVQIAFLDIYQNSDKTFNAYHDIRDKLIAKGMKAKEIAIIGELKTDVQREAVFQRARDGKIRFIIGSTAKLGIGVNIQNKLIAAHHLDAPMRPMDIEQRNGRIVREKNENAEVQIFNYGVKNTLDSVMYDRLMKKQKFIDQMLNGDIDGRTFDEPLGEEQVSYAEMQAAFSGNPLLFTKNDLEIDLKNLRILKSSHERAVSSARRSVKSLKEIDIPNQKENLVRAEGVAKTIKSIFPTGKLETYTYKGEELTSKEFIKEFRKEWDNIKGKIEK